MKNANFQLAQLNIGRLHQPMDHPATKDFKDNLDPINALAESSPGFVWRLQDDSGNATNFTPFGEPLFIVNMSVWEDPESLKHYVYKTAHVEFVKRRHEWFEKLKEVYVVLWWVPAGHQPTIQEAIERLNILKEKGETELAFSFKKLFPPPVGVE